MKAERVLPAPLSAYLMLSESLCPDLRTQGSTPLGVNGFCSPTICHLGNSRSGNLSFKADKAMQSSRQYDRQKDERT